MGLVQIGSETGTGIWELWTEHALLFDTSLLFIQTSLINFSFKGIEDLYSDPRIIFSKKLFYDCYHEIHYPSNPSRIGSWNVHLKMLSELLLLSCARYIESRIKVHTHWDSFACSGCRRCYFLSKECAARYKRLNTKHTLAAIEKPFTFLLFYP